MLLVTIGILFRFSRGGVRTFPTGLAVVPIHRVPQSYDLRASNAGTFTHRVVLAKSMQRVTSVPKSRDAPCRKTNLRFRNLKSLLYEVVINMSLSSAISPLGDQSATRKLLRLIMLSIVSMTPSFAASAVSPSNFRVFRERFYEERICF
jgi:hypothetical protein